MNRWIPLSGTKLLLAAVAAWALAAVSPLPAAGAEDSWDKYAVLVERNMFRRDRRRPQPLGAASTQRAERDSDRGVVLTGIARRGAEFVAFFEDTASNATSKIRLGQAIGKGKVKAITLDGVEYEREGLVRKIGIGWSLVGSITTMPAERTPSSAPAQPQGPSVNGGEPTTSPTQPTTKPAVAAPGASPGGASDSDITDILERMRRRREQELRK